MRSGRIVAMAALAAVAIAGPAGAHDPESVALSVLETACARTSAPSQACEAAAAALPAPFGLLRRAGGGVSYADMRNQAEHDQIVVEAGSFYFSPRILEVDIGQVVTFRNSAPHGGNRHQIASSDWLADDRALPVPGLAFGGGTSDGSDVAQDGFQSRILNPGDEWSLTMEIRDWPGSVVPLGIAKLLIPYHCNVHGASQMNGYILLRTDEY